MREEREREKEAAKREKEFRGAAARSARRKARSRASPATTANKLLGSDPGQHNAIRRLTYPSAHGANITEGINAGTRVFWAGAPGQRESSGRSTLSRLLTMTQLIHHFLQDKLLEPASLDRATRSPCLLAPCRRSSLKSMPATVFCRQSLTAAEGALRLSRAIPVVARLQSIDWPNPHRLPSLPISPKQYRRQSLVAPKQYRRQSLVAISLHLHQSQMQRNLTSP
jgi:hypothetical protein